MDVSRGLGQDPKSSWWCVCYIYIYIYHLLSSWLHQTEDKPGFCFGPAEYLSVLDFLNLHCGGEPKKPFCNSKTGASINLREDGRILHRCFIEKSSSLTLGRRCFQGFDVRKFPFLFVATRPCLACLQG